MAVSTLSSGVFSGLAADSTGLHIPLAAIQYGSSTLGQSNASGDYRALMRGITQTYWNFMSGTATGTDNASDFNKPSYFSMTRTSPSVSSSTKLTRSYSSKFTFELGDPLNLNIPPES